MRKRTLTLTVFKSEGNAFNDISGAMHLMIFAPHLYLRTSYVRCCAYNVTFLPRSKSLFHLSHHVIGEDGQQQLEFIRLDVNVGLDRVPRPDGTPLKHLPTKNK